MLQVTTKNVQDKHGIFMTELSHLISAMQDARRAPNTILTLCNVPLGFIFTFKKKGRKKRPSWRLGCSRCRSLAVTPACCWPSVAPVAVGTDDQSAQHRTTRADPDPLHLTTHDPFTTLTGLPYILNELNIFLMTLVLLFCLPRRCQRLTTSPRPTTHSRRAYEDASAVTMHSIVYI